MIVRYMKLTGIGLALCIVSAGCADTNKPAATQPLSTEAQQKKILDDPMNYGPNEDPNYVAQHGLGMGGSDRPPLSQQIHDFWNP